MTKGGNRDDPRRTLFERAQSGDQQALMRLIDSYSGLVYISLRKLAFKDQRAMEDLIHEIRVSIWQSIGKLHWSGARAFGALLCKRLRYILLESHRTRGSVPNVDPDTRADPFGRTPSSLTSEKEALERLHQRYEALPDLEQRVLDASWFKGQSIREIAEELHMSVGSVYTLMKSILAKLRHELGEST